MADTDTIRFSKLDISHKELVESITSRFEPYSDFNFTSLFSWNDGTSEIGTLNGNLVIRIADYITGDPVYSLLGDKMIDNSLVTLLSLAKEIKLVPEVATSNISQPETFEILEDQDNFDYIYSVEQLSSLPGQSLRTKRKAINRFERQYGSGATVQSIDLSERGQAEDLLRVFNEWAEDRGLDDEETRSEAEAIDRLLAHAANFDLIGTEARIDGKVVGFSIHEVLGRGYAVCHFQKSILSYDNLDPYLTNAAAQELRNRDCEYVNWEQDLGLPGLRELKSSYKPVKRLKKYIIRHSSGRTS